MAKYKVDVLNMDVFKQVLDNLEITLEVLSGYPLSKEDEIRLNKVYGDLFSIKRLKTDDK